MTVTDKAMPEGWWTPAQVIEAMIEAVARNGTARGEELFLATSTAFELDASTELQDGAVAMVGQALLDLAAMCERAAAALEITVEQRRRLIEDTTGRCCGRVLELAATAATAGRA